VASGRIDRRSFLKGGAAAAVGAAAASRIRTAAADPEGDNGCPPGKTHLLDAPPPLPGQPPSNFPVDHIGVLMMENRTYDTYFGWLEGGHGFLNLGLELEYTGFVEYRDEVVTASPEHWAPLYRRCHPHTGAARSPA
jgi:phospholipase C